MVGVPWHGVKRGQTGKGLLWEAQARSNPGRASVGEADLGEGLAHDVGGGGQDQRRAIVTRAYSERVPVKRL